MKNLINTQGSDLLLGALWRSPELHHQLGAMNRTNQSDYRNIPVPDFRVAVTQALSLDKDGWDCYFACAEYGNGDNRKADNVVGAWAFWMDFDCAKQSLPAVNEYATTGDIEVALADFCLTTGVPAPTHVVESGGGLHVYWALDGFVGADVWKAHARQFKDVAKCWGLHADPARTADIASVLRLPGTMNHKYSPARPVNLKKSGPDLDHGTMLQSIRDAHNRLCPPVTKPARLPVAASERAAVEDRLPTDPALLKRILNHIDADVAYEDWLRALMAIFYETHGSDEGLALAIEWSSTGGKFKGASEVEDKWRTFRLDVSRPVTVGTLITMAGASGADTDILRFALELGAEPSTVPLAVEVKTSTTNAAPENPLAGFSLLDRGDEVERQMVEEVPFLGSIAVLGQSTVWYAKPNTGKTLLVLHLIIDGIKRGVIDPSKLYYINMDDNSTGLVTKLRIAEEYRFNMLSDGYRGFEAKLFSDAISTMIDTGTACGTIIILDTLKKFVDLMDKSRSSGFARLIRRFVVKGGTVLGLAHANKHPGADGKPVFSGTSDIVDDFDCAFTLAEVPQIADPGVKVVEFNNLKGRGSVAKTAAYSYSKELDVSYLDLLMSVSDVDQTELMPIKEAAAMVADADLIDAVRTCIREGVCSKMKLAEGAAERAKATKRAALAVIEKYTGDDPERHHWSFKVGERGAKMFAMLEPVADPV